MILIAEYFFPSISVSILWTVKSQACSLIGYMNSVVHLICCSNIRHVASCMHLRLVATFLSITCHCVYMSAAKELFLNPDPQGTCVGLQHHGTSTCHMCFLTM